MRLRTPFRGYLSAVNRSRLLTAFLMPGVVVVLLTACGKGKSGGFPPAPVTVATAAKKNVPVILEAIGTVEPYKSVAIKAQVSGEIEKVAFREGQDVKKGDLLLVIDQRPYQASLQAARGNLQRDKARLTSARLKAGRYADLVKKDYVTKQQFDDATAEAESLEATVQSDEAAVRQAELDLAHCSIRAPVTGRTGNLLVQQGNVIKSNDTVLLSLNQITPVYVSFSVPEKNLSEVRHWQELSPLKVSATSPSGGETYEGKLSMINNSVDQSTGMVLLKAVFPNEDKAMWPGVFVNVRLRLKTSRGSVVIPSKALQRGQRGEYVFVVKSDMTVESRNVTTGQETDGETVIEKGVANGEKVVTDGQLRLFPGAKVVIQQKKASNGGEGGNP